jgi:hypothetical protein
MSDTGLPPWFLARIDQERAETKAEVLKLAAAFRRHADEVHDGDPICAHALCAFGLVSDPSNHTARPIDFADLVAGTVAELVDRDRTIDRLRRELGEVKAANDRLRARLHQ